MELTGKAKEIGKPSIYGHSTSAVISSSRVRPSHIISGSGERIDQQMSSPQTLNHHPSVHLHKQLGPQHQNKQTMDPQLIPDPASITAPVNTASTPNRPILRSSPPVPSTEALSTTSTTSVRYRECMKNHAASMGGHVVDGCGEFMANGEEGTPEALICAACECHRNFHRKEIDGQTTYAFNLHYTANGHGNTLPPQLPSTSLHQQCPPPQHPKYHHPGFSMSTSTGPFAPIMMNFGGGGGGAESSSEDLNMFQSHIHGQASTQQALLKKRFRTKFSQEQKIKMMEFAEKLGWKMQKLDDKEVQQFCSQVGVKRKVFKVWMHNNKQVMKRKQM